MSEVIRRKFDIDIYMLLRRYFMEIKSEQEEMKKMNEKME